MPVATICRHRGCDELALEGQTRCEEHAPIRAAEQAARRQGAKAGSRQWSHLYQTRFWKDGSKAHRAANPLCVDCLSLGLVVAANEVDHIIPHRGDLKLFRERANWQSLCRPCHSRKTATEVLHSKGGGGVDPQAPHLETAHWSTLFARGNLEKKATGFSGVRAAGF